MEGISTVQQTAKKNRYGISVAIITWISLILQFCITDISFINFFSYFTILSNLLIALCLTLSILMPNTKAGSFFSKLSVQTSIALYIFIVSLVYNTALRGIVTLTGIAWMIDNMVHVVVPFLYIVFWILCKPAGVLKWKNGLSWALFPIFYLTYSMIRGHIVGWYPYPFLNAIELGYPRVILNVIIMIVVFVLAGLILIALTKRLKKAG